MWVLKWSTAHTSITVRHASNHIGWLLVPCSPGQGLTPGDSSQLCSYIVPYIPKAFPGSLAYMPSLWASRPARDPASIHIASQPSIHSYTEWLTSCALLPTPEQGFSLGDSSLLCSPPHASHSLVLPWVPPQGTGHWEDQESLYTPISLSLSDSIALSNPTTPSHLFSFFLRLLQAFTDALSLLSCGRS